MKVTLPRMQGYVNQSIVQNPQLRRGERLMEERGDQRVQIFRNAAEYLASINRSKNGQWNFDLKMLPRPKGRATQVVYTEYDLPRDTISPHDVVLDKDGIAWYSSFGEQFFGRLDPKTGAVKEYAMPLHKPDFPKGSLGLRADRAGNWWLGNMYQAAIVKFDPKTEQFTAWPMPPEYNIDASQVNMVRPESSHVDGKVWSQNNGFAAVHRLDLASGQIETFEPYKTSKIAAQHLRRHPGLAEQRLLHRLPQLPYRPDRRQDQRDQDLHGVDAAFGAAPRLHGRAGPAVVRHVPGRSRRPVQHPHRDVQGMADADQVGVAVRCGARPE